ncbi:MULTISPECIES: hypothetical protein [unclassified Streptomyces]|nr:MULTISPECIES: hypothetical protein [unclassified Streptomyces]
MRVSISRPPGATAPHLPFSFTTVPHSRAPRLQWRGSLLLERCATPSMT